MNSSYGLSREVVFAAVLLHAGLGWRGRRSDGLSVAGQDDSVLLHTTR